MRRCQFCGSTTSHREGCEALVRATAQSEFAAVYLDNGQAVRLTLTAEVSS